MSNAKSGISGRNPIKDVGLLIPMGVYPGITSINKFGRNIAVASGASEEIWDGSAVYVFPATALMVKLSQTTDQTALRGETVEIQGLDANWAAVTQEVVLDGTLTTTAVVLATPLIRAFRMRVLSAVAPDSTVRLHNSAESQDYAIIGVGNNQTLMAIYTVPAGHTAYMKNVYATYLPGGGAPTALTVKLFSKDNANGYVKHVCHISGLAIAGTSDFTKKFRPYKKFTEKMDIFVELTTVGAAADVSAGFDLIIVDNSIYGAPS